MPAFDILLIHLETLVDRIDRLGDLPRLGISVGEVVEGGGGGGSGGGEYEVVQRLGLVLGPFMRVYICRSISLSMQKRERTHFWP